MHRRYFKSFLCIFLVCVMCFGFAAPAFASSASSVSDFISGLLGGTLNPPSGITTAVSNIATFAVLRTALLSDAETLLNIKGDTPPADLTALQKSAYSAYFDAYFTQDFSTVSTDRYIPVTLTDLTELASALRRQLPVALSYMPSTGYWYIALTHTSVPMGTQGGSRADLYREIYWTFLMSLTEAGEDYEGAALKGLPYIGNYILVAPASGVEPDFFSPSDKTSSAGTTGRDYYIDDSYVDNSVNDNSVKTETTIYNGGDTFNSETFDYSNGTWYDNVSGTVNDIETLYYNPDNSTYTVNNTYNITYEYNYTYYYNLGSSENLVQDYKFYYELPDGRSSADLTADEIAGLSFEFDVVNYDQDRTDENTKILVPFNGSWEDTAYNGPDLRWVRGASITYKESAAFEGAIYMDGNTTSVFGFNAVADVSKIPSQGYTLQFRYYADALNANTSAQYWPLLVAPFGCGQTTTWNYNIVPWFWVGVDGYIYYRALTGGGIYYSNHNSGATRIGKLTAGTWNDVTVSYVPINSSTIQVNFFINGVLQTVRPTFAVKNFDEYSKYTKSFYPFFAWNVQSLNFYQAGNLENMFKNLSIGLYENSGPYQMIDNLRVVDFALYDGSSNFTPTPVPFDTNLVYVLPDTTNLKDNTIAVQSGVPVSGYRIGGVRPTFPDKGMVWMPLENNKISDCQIYNGSYWESVGCRVWTGERWVPAWAFDVVTLSDLWDIYGGENTDNYTEITPGSFYQWFQQQFLEFKTSVTDSLNAILEAMGVSVEGEEDITEPDANGNAKFSILQFIERIKASIITVPANELKSVLSEIVSVGGGFVSGVFDFFSGLNDMDDQSDEFFSDMSGVLGETRELVHQTWNAIPVVIRDALTTFFFLTVFGTIIAIFLR